MRRYSLLAVCAALAASTALAAEPDAAKGKSVFAQCAGCHATTDRTIVGPGLKGLFHRARLSNGQKPTDAAVRAKIDAGGSAMPGYKNSLNSQQKADLIAFLKTL